MAVLELNCAHSFLWYACSLEALEVSRSPLELDGSVHCSIHKRLVKISDAKIEVDAFAGSLAQWTLSCGLVCGLPFLVATSTFIVRELSFVGRLLMHQHSHFPIHHTLV